MQETKGIFCIAFSIFELQRDFVLRRNSNSFRGEYFRKALPENTLRFLCYPENHIRG